MTKHVGNLAIVSVDEAGHMNPHDQPEATLEVLERWIKKSRLDI
jgi:carboxypeptidase C (cathepsin A)